MFYCCRQNIKDTIGSLSLSFVNIKKNYAKHLKRYPFNHCHVCYCLLFPPPGRADTNSLNTVNWILLASLSSLVKPENLRSISVWNIVQVKVFSLYQHRNKLLLLSVSQSNSHIWKILNCNCKSFLFNLNVRK